MSSPPHSSQPSLFATARRAFVLSGVPGTSFFGRKSPQPLRPIVIGVNAMLGGWAHSGKGLGDGKLISAAELDLPIGIPPAVLKLLELGQWNRARYLAEEVTAHQAEHSWPVGRGFNYIYLRWRPLIHPRNAATYRAATLYVDGPRG
jgi:hypothetical protein